MKKLLYLILMISFLIPVSIFGRVSENGSEKSINAVKDAFDGTWNIRCNSTSTATLTITGHVGNCGTFIFYDENGKVVAMFPITGSSYYKQTDGSLVVSFKGAYDNMYYGWISTDGNMMSGYYVQKSDGLKYPFNATR